MRKKRCYRYQAPNRPNLPPRKEHADCCLSRRDELGRFPIGWCSRSCIRRPEVWAEIIR